ncbi:MAG: hypothetical protein ACJAVR_003614 [Paracoccaceae bacterium]|jgi:uncharacterized protein (DUF302 family)
MNAPSLRAVMISALVAAAPLAIVAPVVAANDTPARTYQVNAPFEDVVFDLRLAIEGRGYKVDNVSHVGEMLNRTAAAVGASVQVYDHAEVIQFCSATLSRKVMEADAMNIAFCPYGIFAYQPFGTQTVTVGYRRFPEGAMQEVDALLDSIAREAAGLD